MAWVPSATSETAPGYEDWPVSNDASRRRLVGTAGSDKAPVIYDPDERAFHRARVDEENGRLIPGDESEWTLEATETLGEGLERIGRETGWEWLSEFARERIEPDDA